MYTDITSRWVSSHVPNKNMIMFYFPLFLALAMPHTITFKTYMSLLIQLSVISNSTKHWPVAGEILYIIYTAMTSYIPRLCSCKHVPLKKIHARPPKDTYENHFGPKTRGDTENVKDLLLLQNKRNQAPGFWGKSWCCFWGSYYIMTHHSLNISLFKQ